MVELKVLSVRYNLFAALASLMNLTAIGIKFNGLNYDEWIEYVMYYAGITCIDTALVMENKPTDSNTEAENMGGMGKVESAAIKFLKIEHS